VETTLDTRAEARAGRGVLWIAAAAFLWGTVGIVSGALFRIADTDPLSIGLLRMGIAAPALAVVCWATLGRRMFAVARRDAAMMLVIGVTMALYQVCFFAAIERVGVAVAVLVTLCSAPVLVALLAWALLGERLTRWVLVALVCALGGTALLVGGGAPTGEGGAQALSGVLLALGASAGFALMTLCTRALAGRYHPILPFTWGLTASALLLLPFGLAGGLALSYPAAGWGLLLYLGLAPTALAFVLFLVGMRHVTATAASIVTLLEPLTATALAWLLFGERLGPGGLLGAALLLGAIALLAWRTGPAERGAGSAGRGRPRMGPRMHE
jgi:DME family drug/metabolite transporter